MEWCEYFKTVYKSSPYMSLLLKMYPSPDFQNVMWPIKYKGHRGKWYLKVCLDVFR